MLIGLGEPLLDPKIFERIEYCATHNISTLLSTNGTLLDEASAEKLLATPLEHITLSFDGSTKESFEYYRKGARFERVRENFVRFARLKHERKSKVQIVVQMVRMEKNWDEVDEFVRFWRAVPGVDEVRIKADETNLMRPDRGHAAGGLDASLSLSLARPDVHQAQWRRISLLPKLHARRRAGRQRGHAIARPDLERRADAEHAPASHCKARR